ncbi:hypothetical protein P692DRAFT_20815070 [Suillus brevipes Sb2]|nr:hypothetical protein P692DRAFT_20815070 [Suillus brevipes Sb2]
MHQVQTAAGNIICIMMNWFQVRWRWCCWASERRESLRKLALETFDLAKFKVQTWLTLRERTIGPTDANDTQLMTTSTQSNVRKVFLKIGHPDYRVQDKDIDKEV